MSLQIKGMDQLLKQLEQVGKNVEETKSKALDESAEILRSKIAIDTDRSTRSTAHAADNVIVEKTNKDEREVGYHKDHFYMRFQELGTSKLKANPVVARTFENEKDKVQEKMKSVIREELGL